MGAGTSPDLLAEYVIKFSFIIFEEIVACVERFEREFAMRTRDVQFLHALLGRLVRRDRAGETRRRLRTSRC